MSKFLVLLMLASLASCVGTVQDAKVKLNNLFDEDKTSLAFIGIEEARAISHNKVELEFTPSANPDPNIKYMLYVNNTLSPVEINPDSLDKAASGRVRYMVDNLSINQKYKFKITLKNSLTGATSKNEREETVTTFDNKTADFKGITSLSKVNGQSDSTIRVDWVSAIMEGSTTTGPWDPLYYEVTIIGEGGIANINNNSYAGTDRRKLRVPPSPTNLSPFNYTNWTNLVIGSLNPNTQYYVQVRAVNRLYDEFLNDPAVTIIPVNKEVNTKFYSIKTDPATGVFDFNVESFKVQPGLGAQAKTRVTATWLPASGSYVGYRLFYIKCTGPQCNNEAEVSGTDMLSDEIMDDIVAGTAVNGSYIGANVLTSPTTSYALTGLDPYKWYQLKLVACRSAGCSKDTGDAIVSSLRVVRTAPILAPFSGLTAIQHPDSAISMDQINMNFDVPDLATGYADKMEFFCIDPTSVTAAQDALDYVKFNPGTTVTGSSITRCNGLSLCGPTIADCDTNSLNYTLSAGTSIRIKGVKSNGTKYCFAAFPAIRDEVEQLPVTNPTKDWIVRCITPEVKTPTIAQFPGVNSGCGVVNNTISVSWPKPVAGIYSAYRVLWRKIEGADAYSFSSAVADVKAGTVNSLTSPYKASPILDPDTLNYTLNNLRPGTRYKVGVLTQTTSAAADVKWSEFNTNVKDCVTAMPKYKFGEWTRIFAIGAKTDGRFPLKRDYVDSVAVRSIKNEAYIFEALNNDGIPYELKIKDTDNTVDLDTTYFKAPGSYGGSYAPAGFGDDFDGAFGSLGDGVGSLVAASKNGIVSLAWKDVTLDFLGDEFKNCQVNSGETTSDTYCFRNGAGNLVLPALKKDRRYGYKVFRSADNRLSWQDITKESGNADTLAGTSLIHAKDYKYYRRPDLPASVDRMAFFTDYSVESIKADPSSKSRARIYWYRIVPYFDNRIISLDSSQSSLVNAPNEIKVILPPDNMALVHRWMSNRQACNEIDRGNAIDKEHNYTCAFNGFGARPKGFPWNPTNSVIDLGGHLLIDRYELGCNYTRGDYNSLPVSSGNSVFKRDFIYTGYASQLPTFKGYATDSSGGDATSKRFMGCAEKQTQGLSNSLMGHSWNGTDGIASNPRRLIQGDCISYGSMSVSDSNCAANPDQASYWRWTFPGAFYEINNDPSLTSSSFDCAVTVAGKPNLTGDLFNTTYRKNFIIQSEFAAVLHHATRDSGRQPINQGPAGDMTNSGGDEWREKPTSCYINLASIGTDGNWTARWLSASEFDQVKGTANVANDTMATVKANGQLFNSTTFKAPAADMMNDTRFDNSTKIGRIISSNAAKLPPITNLALPTAQNLCATYEVELGYSNNGVNFLSLSLPKAKRLLSRTELVAAGAWPEAANNGDVSNADYSITKITSLESNAPNPGYCVGSGKSSGTVYKDHGEKMSANMPRITEQNPVPGLSNGPTTLIGGSSYNESGVNSEKCISKYGIQDLIGNAEEISTERIFCDYGADKLYFGRYESGQGYELESVRMPDYDGGDNDAVWLGAKVIRETGTGDVVVVNGTSTQGRMWPDISPNSGYCSLVDDVDPGATYPTLVSRFRDTNDNFVNVFKPDGTLNTDMVKRSTNIVQANIDKLRNGDGYFLNFGTNSTGPYLQRSNSMALSKSGYTFENGMALGPYFNPITGLPVRCPGSTCSQSEDNMIASTAYFIDDVDAPKPTVSPTIPKFPIGNSQVYNYGISETVYSGGSTSFGVNLDDPIARRAVLDIIYEIRISLGGGVSYTKLPLKEWAIMQFGSYSNAATQYFSKLRFVLPRGSAMQFTYGGGATTEKTGRYSASTVVATNLHTKRVGTYTSARCGVLIED